MFDRMSDNEIARYESLLKTLPQAQLISDKDVSYNLNCFTVSFLDSYVVVLTKIPLLLCNL